MPVAGSFSGIHWAASPSRHAPGHATDSPTAARWPDSCSHRVGVFEDHFGAVGVFCDDFFNGGQEEQAVTGRQAGGPELAHGEVRLADRTGDAAGSRGWLLVAAAPHAGRHGADRRHASPAAALAGGLDQAVEVVGHRFAGALFDHAVANGAAFGLDPLAVGAAFVLDALAIGSALLLQGGHGYTSSVLLGMPTR